MNKTMKQTPAAVLPYAIAITLLHAIGLGLLVVSAPTFPALWGMALIAYTLGMRHAFDIDHIAAIDNSVRKLMQQAKNPNGVGFFFALGHSSVVFLMVLFVAVATRQAQHFLPAFEPIAQVIGPTVAGSFLLIIGVLNLFILSDTTRAFRRVQKGESSTELEADVLHGGAITRIAKPLFKMINKSWHLYPLGFLFGLGFDTASEIALLALSGGAASSAMPWTAVMTLPILFASGMTLFDTLDSFFMSRAFQWANEQPLRKLFYNLIMTVLSIVAALTVGFVLIMQVLQDRLNLNGVFWSRIAMIDFGNLGLVLVGLFLLVWLCSVSYWKLKVEPASAS